MSRIFIDSNVWVYFLSENDSVKREKSDLLLDAGNIVVSTQVVNEVVKILRNKYGADNESLSDLVDFFFNNYPVVKLDRAVLKLAMSVRCDYPNFDNNRSYWDSNVVGAALYADCEVIYSEDWTNGEVIKIGKRKVKVINPYK